MLCLLIISPPTDLPSSSEEVSIHANFCMARAFTLGNLTVYVFDERGAPHHRAHAHIRRKGQQIATVLLETLTLIDAYEPLPKPFLDRLAEEQENMIQIWIDLNE
jgi:hypothetical protein